jgi:hypothetical protein
MSIFSPLRRSSSTVLIQEALALEESEESEYSLSLQSPPFPVREMPVLMKRISISGICVNPHVELMHELPAAPLAKTIPVQKSQTTELQKKQVIELFEHLVESGRSRKEALVILGPLAPIITKYKHSFYVSEAPMTVSQLIKDLPLYDLPFMAPIRR